MSFDGGQGDRHVLAVVPVVPSRTWDLSHLDSQESRLEHQPSLLGLSMRICEPELALDNVWHVLDVLEGSPAESAGLVPYGDWIVGWSSSVLSAEGDFYELVESVSRFSCNIFDMRLTHVPSMLTSL
jgi:hypothetical protein